MLFLQRPASAQWEQVPCPITPNLPIWVWFRPASAPLACLAQIPPEVHAQIATRPELRSQLTIRSTASWIGIDLSWVVSVLVYGQPIDPQQGRNPISDIPLSTPPVGGDPTILYQVHPAVMQAPGIPGSGWGTTGMPVGGAGWFQPTNATASVPASGPATGRPPDPATEQMLVRMAVDWQAILQLEQQLDAAAKQLGGTAQRLNSLNRDLSPEENRFADQQDKREWQDARRWLRDASTKISRFLKEHTVGVTSAAGKRDSFATIYQTYVAPRQAFDGVVEADREFSGYRKLLQGLLNNMNSAQGSAVQDAERRAQAIITRMAARVRAGKSRK